MTVPPDAAEQRRPHSKDERGGRSRFWGVLFAAAVTLVAADLVARWLAPPRGLREVADAVEELERGDPTVLVIGSSHGRTFAVMDDSLRRRTGDRERMLAVPVEWGKLTSYRWTLEERLLPLFDERDATGTPRRPSLRRAIVVTEWWDSCGDDRPPRNLPARAWRWRDYVADVRANGLTEYNANFLGYRWSRFFRASALVQDRGHGRVLSGLRQRLVPSSPEATQAHFEEMAATWQRLVDEGEQCLGAPREMEALAAIVDTLRARGLEVTVLLYPRMPVTLSARARATTIPRFAALVGAAMTPRGVRVVDLSTDAPLTDAEFGDDFDHILPQGNERFSGWALDGPLAFLLVAPP